MDDFERRVENFNRTMEQLPESKLQEESEKWNQKCKEDFETQKQALEEGNCSYCNKPITFFAKNQPCLHWLLNPKGFRKRYFPKLFELKCFHEINTYCRWVANSHAPFRNINDLSEEKSRGKIIEETIKYKNVEWSFSCDQSDLKGHPSSNKGQMPHWHFQMKIEGNVIISYSSFHIPFHDYDHFQFAVKAGSFPKIQYRQTDGAGMQTVFEKVPPELLLETMTAKSRETDPEVFKLDTLITAKNGISGERIAEIIKKSKKTGTPLAVLARELNDVNVETIISPGTDVPEIAKRKPRKR